MTLKKITPAKKTIAAICTCIFLLQVTGCYYDKEEILYPQGVCDNTNTTYSRSIVPILNASCNSCHGGNTPSAAIGLDNYAGVKAMADNGKLLGAVSHAAGFSPMPKNAAKISDCNIAKINKWIAAGALNN
jgi:cytochrome c553